MVKNSTIKDKKYSKVYDKGLILPIKRPNELFLVLQSLKNIETQNSVKLEFLHNF